MFSIPKAFHKEQAAVISTLTLHIFAVGIYLSHTVSGIIYLKNDYSWVFYIIALVTIFDLSIQLIESKGKPWQIRGVFAILRTIMFICVFSFDRFFI